MKHIVWEIQILSPPPVYKSCARCGKKSAFLSSGRFRVNAHRKTLDVWLIYRCADCGAVWNAPVVSRAPRASLSPEALAAFQENDAACALRCAMDRAALRKSGVEPGLPAYAVLGPVFPPTEPVRLDIRSPGDMPLHLSDVIRKKLRLSRKDYDRLADAGAIRTVPLSDPRRARLKPRVTVLFHGPPSPEDAREGRPHAAETDAPPASPQPIRPRAPAVLQCAQRKETTLMKPTLLYIHGKGGGPEEAAWYGPLLPAYTVRGVSYRDETPGEAAADIRAAYDEARREGPAALLAVSLGAYFAMLALGGADIARAFFISPVLDMEGLIASMMARAGVTENELREKKRIPVDGGETLSWAYLSYVRTHPVRWTVPTDILCGGRDALLPQVAAERFAAACGARLTVMETGGHWFHTVDELHFLRAWLRRAAGTEDIRKEGDGI